MPLDTLTLALQRFKLAEDADKAQRLREREDLEFQVPELMWTAAARQSRQGYEMPGVNGMITMPAAPMISIPTLDQPIALITNQERAAHLGVQVHPLSEDADDDTAEVLQGLYRKIEVDSRAGLARSWAFDRAVKCGRGAYRILTEYADDEGGHASDQRIVIKRLLYQGAPYFDPFAQEPDWSDGEWAFVVEDMPIAKLKRRFKDSVLAAKSDSELIAIGNEQPGWIGGDDEASRSVRVAEYFRKEYTTTKIPGEGSWKGRDREDVKVIWSCITAVEELGAPQEWPGKYIPIIPMIGVELQPFDGSRRWTGVYGPNKDAARMVNYSATKAVEAVAIEPQAPFDIDPEEIEGYENWWNQYPTRRFPYMPRKKFLRGQSTGQLQRIQADTSKMQLSVMLLEQSTQFIHTGTGAFEPALGQSTPSQRTKGGVLALQQQHDQGSSHFIDNEAEITMTYEAKVILDLIPKVYDRPGRVLRILDLEDKSKMVMANQPFTYPKGPDGAPSPRPQMANGPDGQPMGAPPQGQPLPPGVKHFDLAKGRYGVTVSVGKSYKSRVEQGNDQLGSILQADPALMPILGDLWFKFQEWPGHLEAAERLKKMQPPQLQDTSDPAAAAQQVPALQAQLKQAQAMLAHAAELIKGKTLELQAKTAIEQHKTVADLVMNQADNETKLAVAELGAKVDRTALFLEERARLGVQQADESSQHLQQAHELGLQAQDHTNTLAQQQQAHQQALAQGDQAVAGQLAVGSQPPPLDPNAMPAEDDGA